MLFSCPPVADSLSKRKRTFLHKYMNSVYIQNGHIYLVNEKSFGHQFYYYIWNVDQLRCQQVHCHVHDALGTL